MVMIEQTELVEESQPRIELRRAANPGQFVSYAGSDIARGETLLRMVRVWAHVKSECLRPAVSIASMS